MIFALLLFWSAAAMTDEVFISTAPEVLNDVTPEKAIELLLGHCQGNSSCGDLLKGHARSGLKAPACRAIAQPLQRERQFAPAKNFELNCVALAEGFLFSPEVTKLCAQAGKTTGLGNRDLKDDCLDYFGGTKASFSRAGLEYCVAGEFREATSLRDCFNSLRDRHLALGPVRDCRERSRKSARDGVRSVFKDCLEEEVARSAKSASRALAKPMPSPPNLALEERIPATEAVEPVEPVEPAEFQPGL